jgi:hypothetical protein
MKDEQQGSASGLIAPRPLAADYEHLTPLEYLSLADRERIHTETLHWLLGEDSPINARARLGSDPGPVRASPGIWRIGAWSAQHHRPHE